MGLIMFCNHAQRFVQYLHVSCEMLFILGCHWYLCQSVVTFLKCRHLDIHRTLTYTIIFKYYDLIKKLPYY